MLAPPLAMTSVSPSHAALEAPWEERVRRHTGLEAAYNRLPDGGIGLGRSGSAIDLMLRAARPLLLVDADVWFLRDIRPALAAWDWGRVGMVPDPGVWNPVCWVHHHARRFLSPGQTYFNMGLILCDPTRPAVRAMWRRAAEILAAAARQGEDPWLFEQTAISLALHESGLATPLPWGWNFFTGPAVPWPPPRREEVCAVHAAGCKTAPAKFAKLKKMETAWN